MLKKLLAIGFSVAALSACTKNSGNSQGEGPVGIQGNEILVGEYGSMTGGEATFGISTHEGIQLAFKQANSAGGVKGKLLKLISLDDQGKGEEAATAVQKLITQYKVIAVLGEVASKNSLAAAPIAQQNKIPMITPSSTNPKVTQQGDYIFRVCFIDPFQGTVMAKFARENLKLKNVAILKDMSGDYSVGLAKYFREKFEELGGKIVDEQTYSKDDIDYKAQLTSIRSKKPEAIFIPGYYTNVGLIAKQARGLGLKVPLMGGDGWDSPQLYEIGKDAILGGYFSNHYTTESKDPRVKNFIAAYKKEFGHVPDGLAAMGYDAALVLIDAMKRTQELTPKNIRDALAATKNFPAVTGTITIDENRNASKPAVVVQVKGKDKYGFVATINP